MQSTYDERRSWIDRTSSIVHRPLLHFVPIRILYLPTRGTFGSPLVPTRGVTGRARALRSQDPILPVHPDHIRPVGTECHPQDRCTSRNCNLLGVPTFHASQQPGRQVAVSMCLNIPRVSTTRKTSRGYHVPQHSTRLNNPEDKSRFPWV